ncbi:TIGR02281 family clan AA aspartic protease [Rhodobacteraceae bacterium NNCM2]|nr:TIGR02281 family clan AA aspartic protease [Coraliihabitans acroporae]
MSMTLGGPPSLDMLTPGHPARIVYLTVFGTGIIVSGALRLLIFGGRRTWRNVGIWVLVLGGLGMAGQQNEMLNVAVERITGEPVPSVALSHSAGEVELRRGWDGHYRADTLVNGGEIRLLVDTGASMVLIPHEQAANLGINVDELDFSMPVTTANGRSTVAPVRLDTVEVGPIKVRDVTAAVAHPGTLKAGLLGMSFLDKLTETSFQRDKLIFRLNVPGFFQPAPRTASR